MKVNELIEELKEKKQKVSKATQVRSLIQKQKGFLKKKQSLTDFDEPVLFLERRGGVVELYEKATAGKFVFEHSNKNTRFIELRPSDQKSFPYGDKRVRCYFAHEDRPFAGYDNPIVDGETVMLGYEKTKATDLKYQQSLQRLKNQGRLTWVWIIVGIAGAFAIGAFAYSTWIQPALAKQARAEVVNAIPPTAGFIFLRIKGGLRKWGKGMKKSLKF